LIGSPDGTPPGSGTYVPYPTYFAEQLASKVIQGGGNVVQTSSSDPNLTASAVVEPNGHLDLLVINVNGSTFNYSFPAYSMTVLDVGKVSHVRPDHHEGCRGDSKPPHGDDDGFVGLGDRSRGRVEPDRDLEREPGEPDRGSLRDQ